MSKALTPERIGGVAARVADDAREVAGWWRGTFVLVALLVATALAFTVLAFAAHVVPYFEIDLQLTQAVQSVRNPTLDFVAHWIGWPGFPPQSNIVFGALILLLLIRGHVVAALCQLLAAGGSGVLWYGIAPLVERPRPSPDLVYVKAEIQYGSFPSGHVLNLTAGFGFAWYLAYTLLPRSPLRTAIPVAHADLSPGARHRPLLRRATLAKRRPGWLPARRPVAVAVHHYLSLARQGVRRSP